MYLCLNNRVFECTDKATCFGYDDEAAFKAAFDAGTPTGFAVVPGKQPKKVKEF